jgi:hypothetical protein
MALRIFTILVLLVAFAACEPEEETPVSIDDSNHPVYTGLVGVDYTSQTFDPPIDIQLVWDEQNLYGFGSDSLDLDSDLDFDFFLHVSDLNEDSIHLLDGEMPNPFPNVKVHLENGYDLAEHIETFYIGLGQTADASFASRLDLTYNVAGHDRWVVEDTIYRFLWTESPVGSMYPQGPWYNMSAVHYIGIRKGQREGWVELDVVDYRRPKILRWAQE